MAVILFSAHNFPLFAVGDIILVFYFLECASVFVQLFILLVLATVTAGGDNNDAKKGFKQLSAILCHQKLVLGA